MTNHVHLLVQGEAPDAISGLMQSIGRHYVRDVLANGQPVEVSVCWHIARYSRSP
ncbi:MAG: hypothetical protein PHW13_09195 [Methylococcales bacterium]|nr:hypothetical protein [Methylococcales bacterium]